MNSQDRAAGRAGTNVTSHAASCSPVRQPCRPAQWWAASCQPWRMPRPRAACTAPSFGACSWSKNPLAEGRFGAMFKRLPAFAPSDTLLTSLAQTMVEQDTSDTFLNTSTRLFAGFTFIGQFIDHDITLDTTPFDQQEQDPDAKTNFRTPRYDLDSSTARVRDDPSSMIRPTETNSCWRRT